MRPCGGRWLSLLLASTAAFVFAGTGARADDPIGSYNLFGSPGLVDMPDARMAPDGQLTVGVSYFKDTQHYNFGFQVLPWLETSFRYSGLTHYDPAYPVYYDRSFAFKARLWEEGPALPAVAIGVNDLVGTGIYSGEYIVASKQFGSVDATLGMGWGRLGSAATVKNPFSLFSDSFLRNRTTANATGGTNFNLLFHGQTAGIFGGATWRTPVDGLALSAEYSSDAYTREAVTGNFRPRTQVNIGAAYRAFDSVTFGLDWLYGRGVGGSVTLHLDPGIDPFPQRLGPELPPPHLRSPEEQHEALNRLSGRTPARTSASTRGALVDALWNSSITAEDMNVRGRTLTIRVSAGDVALTCRNAARIVAGYDLAIDGVTVTRDHQSVHCPVMQTPAIYREEADLPWTHDLLLARASLTTIDATAPGRPSIAAAQQAIRKDAAIQQIAIQAVAITGGDAIVYYSNFRYFHEKDAVERLTRVLMADAPPDVERFRLIPTLSGVPQREFDILRAPTERNFDQTGTFDPEAGGNHSSPAPMHNPVLAAATSEIYPRFNWTIFPQFRQQLFDPDNPFAVQFLAGLGAVVELLPGLSLQGEGEFDLYDNFNTLRPADSVLPHVRTDFVKYFSQGKNGIGNLEADYRFRLAPNVFAVARAGYLESMFAGFGGEVLWRPEGQRWALGADLYDVQQRAFDRLFGLRDYRVVTGHVSLYYASPWYGLNLAMRAGQYLAGDRGITFEVTRRFDSGVEIGAFLTRTNVPAAQFGEGSFDKGIIIRIPLGWALPINTQAQFNMDLRPVQRDGGQRLAADAILYDETRRASQVEMDGASIPAN